MTFLNLIFPACAAGKRHRFREGDFDLDLAYITPRLVAMAYPGSGMEGMYRNSLTEVARFLNSRCVPLCGCRQVALREFALRECCRREEAAARPPPLTDLRSSPRPCCTVRPH